MTTTVSDLRIQIFADGADIAGMIELARDPIISGLTTNPTLMRAAGVDEYESFARSVLESIPDLPISFEVIADTFDEMERQALKMSAWGEHVYVKIPVTNTSAHSSANLISRLAEEGIKLNVTALLTVDQVRATVDCLAGGPPSYISVFAGRIADTGRDPLPIMRESLAIMDGHPNLRLIWASPREVLNIVQADAIGCHIITVTHDLLKKTSLLGKDLTEFSLDTVRMFYNDARAAGYTV